MLLFSLLFLLSSWLLTSYLGSVGFIIANCLNMAARISHRFVGQRSTETGFINIGGIINVLNDMYTKFAFTTNQVCVLIAYNLYGDRFTYSDRVGLALIVVSVSASHRVGSGFASRPGHTKDHHYGRSLRVQPDCLKGRVVCGTVYGDMHLKDLSWDQSQE